MPLFENDGITRVVNLHRSPYDVYIGRAGHGLDGYFGNPYVVGEECGRCGKLHAYPAETLPCFREYFAARVLRDGEFRARVEGLRSQTLGCFCKPKPCHGDVIVEYLHDNTEHY